MEDNTYIEASYPIGFRAKDAKALGEALSMEHSVELVGIKRIGISNFLRFFLNHKDIVKTYIGKTGNHIFIPVDLNDLVERELFPFWILTFKRLVDTAQISKTLSAKTKHEISALFLDAIQSRDTFLTIESLRKALSKLISEKHKPTIFFIRFDRIKDTLNQEFFANLAGIRESTGHKVTYVFTSYRTIDDLVPNSHARDSLSIVTPLYLQPTTRQDMKIIISSLKKRYSLSLSPQIIETLLDLCGGYVQYLQLAFIILSQKRSQKLDGKSVEKILLADERIALQSEEIWESLTPAEQKILLKIGNLEKVTQDEKQNGEYLWDTGFVFEKNGRFILFSLLFNEYLKHGQKKNGDEALDFTKKEYALFNLLKSNLNEICERENIISAVWPEGEILGVSDWTIDRLVARLRTKLKKQNSKYSIVTVKTRGYKLVEE